MLDTLLEAEVLIERRRPVYNRFPFRNSLGYGPPAPVAIVPCTPEFGSPLLARGAIASPPGAL